MNDNNFGNFPNQDSLNQNNDLSTSAEQILSDEVNSFFFEPQTTQDNGNPEEIEMLDVEIPSSPQTIVDNMTPVTPTNINPTPTDINVADKYRNIFKETAVPMSNMVQPQDDAPYIVTPEVNQSSYKENLIKNDSFNNAAARNTKVTQTKFGPFNIPVIAYVMFFVAVAHYFLIAPFFTAIFEARSLAQATKMAMSLITEGSGGLHELFFYGYQFLIMAYLLTSIFVVGYAIVNMFNKGSLMDDFKDHLKSMIIVASCISILAVLLFKLVNYDVITTIIKIVTINGNMLKIVPGSFVEFFYKL